MSTHNMFDGLQSQLEMLLMSTHSMFWWRNKKNIYLHTPLILSYVIGVFAGQTCSGPVISSICFLGSGDVEAAG